ncbi:MULTISPECIES: malonate decarboxylase holo-ACP synthase [unclassified Cupriavidus]|uniref:malonate decarboxylase holo-ACP synthase n=1 Tax=Cupriavidus sp. H19C3 TaxID=3241603 RepID=UPI003BF880D2
MLASVGAPLSSPAPAVAAGAPRSALPAEPAALPTLRPHDLIWLDDPHAFAAQAGLPGWADAAWLARAPVVVRRDRRGADEIPVGLRGTTRAQRHGTWLPAAQCARVITPEAVARQGRWRRHRRRGELPALQALARLAARLDGSGWEWGVTGAVGFSLASGIDVMHAGSDIDLLITAPLTLSDGDECWLGALAAVAGDVRLDIQIATPCGAFALAERLRTGGRVLLRTDRGPRLCDDPWCPA